MAALPLTVDALHKSEMEYHGKFGHTLGRIQHIALMSRLDVFCANYPLFKKKLWHLLLLVFKASISVFNIWLFTLVNPYAIPIITMLDQI